MADLSHGAPYGDMLQSPMQIRIGKITETKAQSGATIGLCRLRFWTVAIQLCLSVCLTGCFSIRAQRTVLEMSSCTEEITIEGMHSKIGPRDYELTHDFDLPFTQTQIVVVDSAGTETTRELSHTYPAIGNLVLAGGLFTFAAVAAGFGTFRVLTGDASDATLITMYGSATVASAIGAYLSLTGWHPAESRIQVGKCANQTDTSAPQNRAPPRIQSAPQTPSSQAGPLDPSERSVQSPRDRDSRAVQEPSSSKLPVPSVQTDDGQNEMPAPRTESP